MSAESERVLRAMRGGATAEELDAVLMEIKLERSIRQRAEELARLKINHTNLSVLNDLMRAALDLAH